MDIEAFADAVENLYVPPTADGLRAFYRAMDRLESKAAPAIEAVNQSGEWAVEGSASMVAWLRANARITGGAAKSIVTVAGHVAELPVTRAAWETGALSSAQVRAIVANVSQRRVGLFAEHEADLVPTLIDLTVAQTAAAMAFWREHADALDDRDPERDTERSLSLSRTLGTRRELKGSFDGAGGITIEEALALATTPDAEGEVRNPLERRADALIDICRYYLDNQRTKRGGRHRPHLNVVVDLRELEAGGPGTFIDGTPAPGVVIEALACDANIHRVLKRGRSAILDYGRSVRSAPPDLFNALALRDGHCREPGCDRPPSWCDAHHVLTWEEDGGDTKLSNMVLRCVRHHHLWHKRRKLGWTERLEPDATLVITDPAGRVYSSRPGGPLAQRQMAMS